MALKTEPLPIPISDTLSTSPGRLDGQSNILFGALGLRAGWSLALWLTFFSILAGTFTAIGRHFLTSFSSPKGAPVHPKFMLIGESISLFIVLAATWGMSRIERRRFESFGLGRRRAGAHLLCGIVSGLLLICGLVFALKLGGWLVFDARLLYGASAFRYGFVWAVIFFLLGMFEENMLRGYAQFTLARGIGFWPAAIILSFLFGFVHKNNPAESPVGLASAGLIGLVFCLSLRRTGTLWWAIGFHAAWDWGEAFLFGVPNSGTVDEGRMFSAHAVGNRWLSGGATGPEGSLFVLVAIAIAATIVFITFKNEPIPTSRNES